MISTSTKYKQQLIAGNRNYVVKVNMTLADNTTLLLTNEHLWEQGVVISNGISDEDSFQIGSAIIGSLTLIIDNIKGNYNGYDFLDARLTLWLGVEGDTDLNDDQVYYRIGFYVVDNTTFNGSLITLSCLDNMTWFDVPFNQVVGITYPCIAGDLVAAICTHVGVTLGIAHFPNYTTTIPAEPDGDNNCREILSYVAQKCCCYCKINTAGQLILGWYDKTAITGLTNYDGGTFNTTTTPYSDGCNLDGGSFMSGGDNADGGTFSALQNGVWLTQNFDMSVGTDDIVVTGCRVRKTSGDDTYDELWTDAILELDHPRYVLVIENNPFITSTDAATTANTIGSILAGLPIRGFSSRSLSDFSYETGDMVTILDFRGNIYYTWITNLTFTINNAENFSCGVESLKERGETRYSEAAKTLAEAQQNANKLLTDYDKAVADMNELAQNALGYNKYVNAADGKEITWLYNGSQIDTTTPSNPTFTGSTVVFKISGDGVFISHDGGLTYDSGYDANSGTAILSLLYAIGISCDWVRTGSLTLGGYNNQDGKLVAFANSVLASGSYSGSFWTYIGYSQTQKVGDTPVDIHISNISSLSDFKGLYKLFHTSDGGSTWTLLEQNILAEGMNRVSTVLDVKSAGSDYYALQITQSTGGTATFDYSININKIVTTIDRNGIATTNGSFSGNISGSAISGSSFYLASGGDIVDISNGRIKTQGTWIQLCKNLSDTDEEHFALGYHYSAYMNRSEGFFLQVRSKKIIQAADSYSDRRLKIDIEPVNDDYVEELILNADIKNFKRTYEPTKLRFGVIAQEVREQLDKLGIDKKCVELTDEDDEGYFEINYKEYIPMIMRVVQKQQAEINTLKKEIAELKARVE